MIDRLRAQARDLPFNRYAWLTTHNSFARLGQRSQTGVAIATPWSQQDTVTEQLNVSALCPPLPGLAFSSRHGHASRTLAST